MYGIIRRAGSSAPAGAAVPAIPAASAAASAAFYHGKARACVDESLVQVRALRPFVGEQRRRREGARAD